MSFCRQLKKNAGAKNGVFEWKCPNGGHFLVNLGFQNFYCPDVRITHFPILAKYRKYEEWKRDRQVNIERVGVIPLKDASQVDTVKGFFESGGEVLKESGEIKPWFGEVAKGEICKLCNNRFARLNLHLRSHKITREEYNKL